MPSGDHCFGTNLAADYRTDANVWLRTPELDLTSFNADDLQQFSGWYIDDIEVTAKP